MYAESIGCDYVVMNDVDQIPVSDKITHEWPKDPLHLCTNTDQHGFSFYDAVNTHTHTHTHTYVYVCICVCVLCVCITTRINMD
jgi:hypothetical protein